MKKLLTVAEAAAELGITERAAWHRIYRGQLPHRRWVGRVVIPVVELEKFIRSLPGATVEEALAKTDAAAR